MLLFMDGFDQFKDIPSIQTLLMNSGYTVVNPIEIAPARNETQRAIRIGIERPETTTNASLGKVFSTESQVAVIGFAYKAESARNDIVQIPGLGALAWNRETGKVSMGGASGTAILLLDLWYYFEIRIDRASRMLQVFINNTADITTPLPESAYFLTDYECKWVSGNGFKYIDDVVFVDGSGGRYTDRIGPISIEARMPTSDVKKEWTPSRGDDHWALVSNRPPKDGDYIQSNKSGAVDSFLSNNPVNGDARILAVGLTAINRKSDIDNRHLGLFVGDDTSKTEKVDTELSITNKTSYAVFEQTPTGANWDSSNVATTPFGVIVRP